MKQSFVTIQNNIVLKQSLNNSAKLSSFVTIQNNIVLKLNKKIILYHISFVTIQNNIVLKHKPYFFIIGLLFCYHSK